MLRAAARDSSMSDRLLRNVLIYVNFEDGPTKADIERTHELAKQLGWGRSLANGTWVHRMTDDEARRQ